MSRAPGHLTPAGKLLFHGWDVTESGCWEWRGCRRKTGYGVCYDGNKQLGAHRVAYELWVGPIPESHVVRHGCDNPPCVNPKHLQTGTKKQNSEDMVARNRNPVGSRHRHAKLNENQVTELRLKYAMGGVTQKTLAQQYGVDVSQIGAAIRRESWKHVE